MPTKRNREFRANDRVRLISVAPEEGVVVSVVNGTPLVRADGSDRKFPVEPGRLVLLEES